MGQGVLADEALVELACDPRHLAKERVAQPFDLLEGAGGASRRAGVYDIALAAMVD